MTTQVTKTSHFKFDKENIMQLELSELKFTTLQKKALAVYIEGMTNLGCKFKVTDPNGEVYETKKPSKEVKRVFMNKGISKYITPYIENLPVGQSVHVPIETYSADTIQQNITSKGIRIFGKNSIMTSRCINEKYIEVLRVK